MEKLETAELEKVLVSQLSNEMDKSQLSSLTKSIAGLSNSAYLIDWRWVGTPAFWDLVRVNYQVPIKEFNAADFLGNSRFDELRIIRKGTPVPRFYEIEALVRNSRRQF